MRLTLALGLLTALRLLPVAAQLSLLPLLPLLLLQLLQLLLQLFRLATKLFLLPAAIDAGLLLVLALLRELLLAASQLFQLLHRVVDGLLLLIAGGRLLRFVLVLLGIELQVEQVRQIAAGIRSAASATAALAAGHLNVAERRHGAREVLQRLVLGLQGIRPLLAPSACRPPESFRPPPLPFPW